MNLALATTRPSRKLATLMVLRALLVFVPIAAMKFMPESSWFWAALLAGFLFLFTSELVLAFRLFQGRLCAAAVAGSVGFTVVVLPLVACAAFILSLLIGTFVFPPR
jgi:hypothetical protein